MRVEIHVADGYESRMLRHLQTLLVLRVSATFAVVVGHAASFFDALSFTQWPHAPYMQSIAVTLFFAISGFTIAWVVDRSKQVGTAGVIRFAYDRFVRLAVPLIPTLFLFLVAERALLVHHPYPDNTGLIELLGNALLLQNLAPGVGPFGLNRPLWTISLEFWIYIAFGCAAFAIRAKKISTITVAALLLSTSLLFPFLWTGRGAGLPLVWLGGAALYALLSQTSITQEIRLIAAICLILCCRLIMTPSLWPDGGEYSHVYNGLILSAFAAFMVLQSPLKLPAPALHIADFFGSFAYTLYLTHYPIMYLLDSFDLLGDGLTAMLIVCAVCVLFAFVWSLPFERNYRLIRERLRTRLFPNL